MKKLKSSKDPVQKKIVLPDECGDSLWHEVLAQEDNGLTDKSDRGKKDLPGNNDNIQEPGTTKAI
jgi:hypothetical protein